jgi:hypothetical protein
MSPRCRRTVYLLFLGFLLVAAGAAAQTDTGVYGPAAPENAGFVRVLNADGGRDTVELPIGPRRFGPVSYGEVSPYRPLRAGISLLRHGGAQAELIVRPDSYTTVVVTADDIVTIADERHTDPARAQLVLYNIADRGPLDLVVAPDGAVVFEDVGRREAARRSVNAVSVNLAVRAPDGIIDRIDGLRLTRGDSFGIFVIGDGAGTTAYVHPAEVVVDD